MAKSTFTLRQATTDDARALLTIYEEYIDTSITFEFTPPSLEEFAASITTVSEHYPYLVAEENGSIVGFAYAHEFKQRAAYQWGAELSVYLSPKVHGSGLGKRFYSALIDVLRLQGVRTVYGIVTSPNEKSECLHESLGFLRAGTMHNSGYKAGAWHDVVWYEKQIGPYDKDPAPLKRLYEIDQVLFDAILKRD